MQKRVANITPSPPGFRVSLRDPGMTEYSASMSMEKISAWTALAMAAMFAVNAYFQFATGVSGILYVGVALILASGAIRTLRKMSGGLRLLCGAWGATLGVFAYPLSNASSASPLALAFLLIALAGLAMTVLHKEKK